MVLSFCQFNKEGERRRQFESPPGSIPLRDSPQQVFEPSQQSPGRASAPWGIGPVP